MNALLLDQRHIFRRQSADEPDVRMWEAKSVNIKAHVVCATCNNGWMSDLENKHAKPAMQELILSDSPVSLTPERIHSIVLFAFKTAIVCHRMQRKTSPYFPASVFTDSKLRRFASSLYLPMGIQVWLGCVAKNESRNGVLRMRYSKTPAGVPNGFKLYVCTFAFGRFIWQLTASEWTKARQRRSSLPTVTQHPQWNAMAVPVWPLPIDCRNINWPPSQQLVAETIDAFGDRWKRFGVPAITFPY